MQTLCEGHFCLRIAALSYRYVSGAFRLRQLAKGPHWPLAMAPSSDGCIETRLHAVGYWCYEFGTRIRELFIACLTICPAGFGRLKAIL